MTKQIKPMLSDQVFATFSHQYKKRGRLNHILIRNLLCIYNYLLKK